VLRDRAPGAATPRTEATASKVTTWDLDAGMETSRSRSSDRSSSACRTRYPRGISMERIRSSRLMHAHVRWWVGRTCPGTVA